jgi:hypothetical protein
MPSASSDHEFWPSLDLFCLCSCAESNRSEQEVELWTELQTTRGQLKLDEDRLKQVEDKAEFMETLNEAAVSNKCSSTYLCNFIYLEQNS